ncbi:MAG: hypothetical protein OXF61_06720 [Acidimicrobiaceae bacterium]|nr:hypothetical protein [Acidimicrobiaceae bacterium]
MSEELDHRAARVVLKYLDASNQGDAALDIEAYLGLGDYWHGLAPEPVEPTSSDDDAVLDNIALGHALLDLIRSLPPVQAAFIGVLEVSPPWWGTAETMPIGKIVNMLEIAEDGMLERDEERDWGWFTANPHHQPRALSRPGLA